MKQFFIPIEEFKSLSKKVDQIETLIRKNNKNSSPGLADSWLNIDDVCKILSISRRTLQEYRNQGVLPFSQYHNKIYFLASDVSEHLIKHYRPTLTSKKTNSHG